mmetsp:Transcript_92516/g.239567  ORF Transcript_92516/g.239567 Transcript_92516/m.239567 type:complete len:559 (+) Transcript_92516:3-1679(+)
MREDVPELRVRVLVDTAVGSHAEVAPARDRALELDAVDLAAGGLEAVVRVLRGDARGDDVSRWINVVVLEEFDGAGGVVVCLAIEPTNLRDVFQGDAHAYLELRRRQVHPCQLLGHGMLDLQPRVKLQEVELLALRIEEVLDRPRPDVADVLRQPLRRALHLRERILGHDRGRPFLEDFLEAALRGAVSAVECHGAPVLVADDLHLDVARPLTELHHEDGGPRRSFVLHLREVGLNLLFRTAHPDALAAASLGRLHHHREANALSALHSLRGRCHAALLEGLLGDRTLLREVGREAVAGPWDRRHARRLSQDIGGDLVSQHRHHGRRWADEGDTQLFQLFREIRVLRGVAPSRPDCVHLLGLRGLADEVNVRIVVHILARRNLHERVGQADELRVGVEVVAGRHDDKLEDLVEAQLEVGPLAHREDRLRSCHAVVRDEDPLQHPAAAPLLNVLLELLQGLARRGHGRGILLQHRHSGAGSLGAKPPLPARGARRARRTKHRQGGCPAGGSGSGRYGRRGGRRRGAAVVARSLRWCRAICSRTSGGSGPAQHRSCCWCQ